MSKKAEKEVQGTVAVVKTGGKQYIVSSGDTLLIEKLADTNGKVVFDEILLVNNGGKTEVGTPFLEGKTVEAEFKSAVRGPKLLIVKYKQKSRYLRRTGHRQSLSKVKISKI
ncbi:MAG TPA: 50S ribosomal protein L21 [Candidatus Paceibacterota bacterium]|nr:50S ribosomal protein L21 [Candidatus Paceibacterota bacterium]